jgi:hypothetical protein
MPIQSAEDVNFWVFRDGRRNRSGRSVLGELLAVVERLSNHPITPDRVISALIRAGELEAALADTNSPSLAQVEELTNQLAGMLWPHATVPDLSKLAASLNRVAVPESLVLSPPEGFAYYALHPRDFASLAEVTALPSRGAAAVIGIRSIGTTLSAIVTAALRSKGRPAERITVRPTGHPYNRELQFTLSQLKWIHRQRELSPDFLIVDEGPGRSGSSFLSVGEALISASIVRERIMFLGSRPVDPTHLCARDALSRWNCFRFACPEPGIYQRFSDDFYIGGGTWRGLLIGDQSKWPACWPQMERFKFLSRDKTSILKFEGLGRFGEEVLDRAQRLASAGFGPSAEDAGDGMIRYSMVPGNLLEPTDLSSAVLDRIAQYCAFRKSEFSLPQQPSQVAEMFRFNLLQAFDVDLNLDAELLTAKNPALVDGRMQPHEWIRRSDGRLVKVDACTHGDDHFFPGPTDIAWDLAGAIVEWNLDADATNFLLARYHCLTGDDPCPRIPIYTLAYTIFRLAYCKMARTTALDTEDDPILQRAISYYRSAAEQQLHIFRQRDAASVAKTATIPNYANAAD